MNKPNTVCRVCGKEYFCCSDSKAVNSWRTMACSPNCFKEYMKRIDESRNPKSIEEIDKEVKTENVVKMKYRKKKATVETNEENETEKIIED